MESREMGLVAMVCSLEILIAINRVFGILYHRILITKESSEGVGVVLDF